MAFGQTYSGAQAQAWQEAIVTRLANEALKVARPQIPSRTLRDAIVIMRPTRFRAFLEIPHYWALYIHDGRRPFGPRPGRRYLVWFDRPENDPRLRNGYPVRYADWRPLEPEEFQNGLKVNARLRAIGAPPQMIVRRFQPNPLKPTPFFTTGMSAFEDRARASIRASFSTFILQHFGQEPLETVRFRF